MNIPNMAIVDGPDGKPVVVMPGVDGYTDIVGTITPEKIDEFNREMGLENNDQVRAMKTGSMFGWDCPAVMEAFRDNS
jgi:hypothetical protein